MKFVHDGTYQYIMILVHNHGTENFPVVLSTTPAYEYVLVRVYRGILAIAVIGKPGTT